MSGYFICPNAQARQLKILPVKVQREIVNCFVGLQQEFEVIQRLKRQAVELRQEIRDIFVHKS